MDASVREEICKEQRSKRAKRGEEANDANQRVSESAAGSKKAKKPKEQEERQRSKRAKSKRAKEQIGDGGGGEKMVSPTSGDGGWGGSLNGYPARAAGGKGEQPQDVSMRLLEFDAVASPLQRPAVRLGIWRAPTSGGNGGWGGSLNGYPRGCVG